MSWSVALLVFAGVLLGSKKGHPSSDVDINDLEKSEDLDKATFAGGCFWCMEYAFEHVEGVKESVSGYTGGDTKNPTYQQVSTGRTGHYESVRVYYDPEEVTYQKLLDVFWRNINPTDSTGQFSDRGSQYRTAIFYHNENQRQLAMGSKSILEKSENFESPIVTEILPAQEFYPAEEYHQDYYKKKSARYNNYKRLSGREGYIEEKWGGSNSENKNSPLPWKEYQKPTEEELKDRLNDLQFKVAQQNKTEPPFNNEYWDNKKEGIYVDIVSGEPLFSSNEKFESGTGWPSFYAPLEPENILEKEDSSLGMNRIEVRSKHADSHLGHLFYDGPPPTGKRYCINSAALNFIPKEKLEERGYAEYLKLFR